MKFAVLSDARLPTNATFPGHGMGRVNLTIANGLLARGHDITLYAGIGSAFAGRLITATDERAFVNMPMDDYDAILDGGHFHTLGKMRPGLPVVNLSQDREDTPGKNAVFSSAAHRAWHGYNDANGRVVYNGVDVPDVNEPKGDFYLYISMFHPPKGSIMAAEAARLAGVRVVFAGPTPPTPPPGCEYVGPMTGEDKFRLMAKAKALLFPSGIEAGPVTVLEANACGTPVLVTPTGAARENISEGITGAVCRDTLEMAETIQEIESGKRTFSSEQCRQWISECRSVELMIDGYERALMDVSKGVRW